MRVVKAFSQGKVIITGEYGVLSGSEALVAGIDRGVEVELSEQNIFERVEYGEYISYILNFFAKKFNKRILDISIKINSNLPQKSGLGSSSALASALIAALAEWFNIRLTKQKLFEMVWYCENFQHGISSGVDPAGVVFGGLLVFKKNLETPKIELLKIDCLKDKKFLLIDSGQAEESTKEMVELVNSKMQEKNTKEIIAQIGQLTADFVDQLRNRIFDPLFLQKNNALLVELGVLGKKASTIIQQLENRGGFAKITGAGGLQAGSGFILAYHSNFSVLSDFVKENKLESFEISFL